LCLNQPYELIEVQSYRSPARSVKPRMVALVASLELSAMVEKIIDLIGVSSNSIEDAVQIALARAGVTISGIHRAQIKDISAVVDNNKVTQWRVSIQASFVVKDQLHE
jgi:flavin-binding protein dodecin